MNIKPGDLFQWRYKGKQSVIDLIYGESAYSTSMNHLINMEGVCFCIGKMNGILYWLSHGQLKHIDYRRAWGRLLVKRKGVRDVGCGLKPVIM